MLKLLICLIWTMLIGVLLLELRQQRLNLTFQVDELHNRIQATQAQLWNQQLDIAVCTAPNAVAASVKGEDMKVPIPPPTANAPKAWVAGTDTGE
jgi:hypothetical protein